MARVTFTNEDILRAKLLPPKWYPIVVSKYNLEQAGTDGSDLHVYELKVEEGDGKGVPIRFQISEKALGMGVEFLEACGTQVIAGQPVDLGEQQVGKKLDCFVQRGEYKGKPQNNPVQFRKRQAATQG